MGRRRCQCLCKCKHRPAPGNLWSCRSCRKQCCQECIGWRARWRWCHECDQAWVSSNAVGTRTVAERAPASSQDITGSQPSQRNGFQPNIVLSEWTAAMIIHCLGCHPLPWSYTRHFGRCGGLRNYSKSCSCCMSVLGPEYRWVFEEGWRRALACDQCMEMHRLMVCCRLLRDLVRRYNGVSLPIWCEGARLLPPPRRRRRTTPIPNAPAFKVGRV